MKLRNKKTGKIFAAAKVPVDLFYRLEEGDELVRKTYTSITELNAEWEDYDEQSEKEAIEMLKQLSEALDRINANMSKLCGKGKK